MGVQPGHRTVAYGVVDCILGLLAICAQSVVTYYSAALYGQFFPDNILHLGLASVGVWVGLILVLTGVFGIVSGLKQPKPVVGIHSARNSNVKLNQGFFGLALTSAVFSVILIAVSVALSVKWLLYLSNPPYAYFSDIATINGSMGLIMVGVGLITFPLNCVASCSSRQFVRKSRPVSGFHVSTGPSRTQTNAKSGSRTIEVVTRPASQLTLSPQSLPMPHMHELSRNPSFQSAVRHPSQASLRHSSQTESAWSYDF